jgi:two-component system chemotaxis response regulator CheB
MGKIKVLVVDDSLAYRTQIRSALQLDGDIEVGGTAINGQVAIEKMQTENFDLIILDLEMPVMNGVETLKEMKRLGITSKVLLFSSTTKKSALSTLEGLNLGALDFVLKPDGESNQELSPHEKIKEVLVPKILSFKNEIFNNKLADLKIVNDFKIDPDNFVIWDLFKPKILVIGSSTGGPTVLETIFASLKPPFNCPIVIAQHMPAVFTATLVEKLGQLCGMVAEEGKDGQILEKNRIYIAPGNFHLRLKDENGSVKIKIDQGDYINFVRPAVDPLFESAAKIFKDKCLGIILTGMGSDGKDGAIHVKKNGGAIIIQEEKSCVVFGMPGAVFNAKAYDKIFTPSEIIKTLNEKLI